jgi:hypothetical protein
MKSRRVRYGWALIVPTEEEIPERKRQLGIPGH